MSVVSVRAKDFILALFIRDDGERFLLGDNGFDFKNSQLHFVANVMENDEVEKQGTDGTMLAGQVRRSSVQSFDGYVGDGTTPKETVEERRREFFRFFAKGHHFRVVYIDTARNAWQRKGGYIVDAPEIKELYQVHPEYHVGLNFEDVNYYVYDEDADGNEILGNVQSVPVSSEIEGGLEWDANGAISEDAVMSTDTGSKTGKNIQISDATLAPFKSIQIDGETSQNDTPTPSAPVPVQTVTGDNVVKICGKNLLGLTSSADITSSGVSSVWDGSHLAFSGTATSNQVFLSQYVANNFPAGSYILSLASPAASRIIFRFFDSNDSTLKSFAIEAGRSSVAVNLDGTEAKFRFVMLANPGTAYNRSYDIQLELGSTASDYEEYQGQSYPISLGSIELCKIGTYQDYIYQSGEKWYVHKEVGKVILDGVNKPFSVRYTTANSHYRFVYADQSIQNYTSGTVAQIYCNRLIGGTIGNTYSRVERIAYNDASNRLIMYISSIEDYTLAAANIWLESNPITVYYILATPTDTEITNAALVAQLEAILNGGTFAGLNNIALIPNGNEQGTLELVYYKTYEVIGGGYVWEDGGTGGPTTIINNSIDSVYPVWTITGPTLNPILENTTTGEQIEFVGMVGEGQTLVIDMGEQTAMLDGLNVLSSLVGEFISLAPGKNILLYSASGDAGPSEIGWSEIVG